MVDGDKTLEAIREAYAQAALEQPAEQPPLRPWLKLTLELREAFIHVYHAGRRAAQREVKP